MLPGSVRSGVAGLGQGLLCQTLQLNQDHLGRSWQPVGAASPGAPVFHHRTAPLSDCTIPLPEFLTMSFGAEKNMFWR